MSNTDHAPAQDLILEMIEEAALAGAYRAAIRKDPKTAGGFGKLAEKHSRRARQLADALCRWSRNP